MTSMKMNKFKLHIPNYVDTDTPPWEEFETTEDLLSLETVKRFGQGNDFSHFVMSGDHLMEISDNGFRWWVVGTIFDPSVIELPEWDGGKHLAELPNGEEIVLTKEVVSSCGGLLTLSDGRMLKDLKYGNR